MKTELKEIAPFDCSEAQLCQIASDNFSVGDFSILTDGYHVWLSEHHPGEQQKQHIEIPPKVFRKLVNWYLKPQVIKTPDPDRTR